MHSEQNVRRPARAGTVTSVTVLGCAAAALIISLTVVVVSLGPGDRRPTTANALGNPPGMTDRLVLLDSSDAWERGTSHRVEIRTSPAPVVRLLDGEQDAYPRSGTWTSAPIPAEFWFTELIPSFNADVPPDTGVRLDVRVRHPWRGDWSPWLPIGSWGRTPPGPRATAYAHGVVNVDHLVLDRAADAIQFRVTLFSFSPDPTRTPSLRRLAACYSGTVARLARHAGHVTAPPLPESAWARDLRVPFRAQKDAPKAIRGEICSPTSLSMVMAYWGVDRPTVENALAVYDPEHEIFGNWGRAVQRAGELGLDGWVTRFRDWDSVKAEIARGRPVIASIRFEKGEFPSAVLKETDGHLIVVRGFTPEGDVIVNDPASRDRGGGAVYRAEELARAWFGHGGVAYVVSGAGGRNEKPAFSAENAGREVWSHGESNPDLLNAIQPSSR